MFVDDEYIKKYTASPFESPAPQPEATVEDKWAEYKRQVERANPVGFNGGPPDVGYAEHYADKEEHEHEHSAAAKATEAVSQAGAATDIELLVESSKGTRTAAQGAKALAKEEAQHLKHGLKGASVSNVAAPFALASGVNDMIHGDGAAEKVKGGLDAFSGASGTIGLLSMFAKTAGATNAAGKMAGVASKMAPAAAAASLPAFFLEAVVNGNDAAEEYGLAGQRKDENGKLHNRNWAEGGSDIVNSIRDKVADATGSDFAGSAAKALSFAPTAVAMTSAAAVSGAGKMAIDRFKSNKLAEGVGDGVEKLTHSKTLGTVARGASFLPTFMASEGLNGLEAGYGLAKGAVGAVRGFFGGGDDEPSELEKASMRRGWGKDLDAKDKAGEKDDSFWSRAKRIMVDEGRQKDQEADKNYEMFLKAGMTPEVAEMNAGMANPGWKELRQLDRSSKAAYDAQISAGVPAETARVMAQKFNPTWEPAAAKPAAPAAPQPAIEAGGVCRANDDNPFWQFAD